ncbi:MAG: ACP S-malonyltransferase [Ruminococcus sp.]|nr:ACP S-malonyltransferase [Ruminococcus sp.]
MENHTGKTAWIFPGQGVQKCGMGKDFYEQSALAKELFEQASQLLNLDMKALCFEENEKLDQTEYTQAALVTVCLAMTEVLRDRGLAPDMTAGLSLGEYCAIAAAQGMSPLDAVLAVRKRGILMQNAVPSGQGGMAAVLGLDKEKIEQILSEEDGVSIANYNCPGQIVITGYTGAVEEASKRLTQAGAKRVLPLNVSGPFHSPLLEEAGAELESVLEKVTWKPLEVPYVTNVTAEYVTEICQARSLLSRQVSSPVCWEQSMERMIADGVTTFVEIGPGKTLAGFLRKMDKSVKVLHMSVWEDVEKMM